MGNVSSSDENPPVTLAIMAVARECRLEKRQIVALRNAMAGFSNQRGMIDRGGFDKALVLANLASVEILDLLFTMWDNARDGLVPFKEFCVGISLIACPNDEIPAILGFALHVGDIMNRGYLGAESLCNLLSGINLTTSYFGDAHLSPAEIHAVVDAVFESGEIEVITHEACIRKLSSNPYIKRFASGKSRVRVKFKKDLVTKIQYTVDNCFELPSNVLDENHCSRRDRLLNAIHVKRHQSEGDAVSSLLDSSTSWESISNIDPPGTTTQSPRMISLARMARRPRDPPTTQEVASTE